MPDRNGKEVDLAEDVDAVWEDALCMAETVMRTVFVKTESKERKECRRRRRTHRPTPS